MLNYKNELFSKKSSEPSFSEKLMRLSNLEARMKGSLEHLADSSKLSSPENSLQSVQSADQSNSIRGIRPSKPAYKLRSPSLSEQDLLLLLDSDFKKRPRDVDESIPDDSDCSKKMKFTFSDNSNPFSKPEENPEVVHSLITYARKTKGDLAHSEATLTETERILDGKEKQISELKRQSSQKTSEIASLQAKVERFEENSARGKEIITQILRDLEEKKRQELKQKLLYDSFRLGRVTIQRTGTTFKEHWEDGKEILEVKQQLLTNASAKEALEKQKKQLKRQESPELALLPLKFALLNREETALKERLSKLEIEKSVYIQENKRITDENAAEYARDTLEHEMWPVMHDRYLLLSLLGKGGYGEVYKAYDLDEHIELAIKFHQLNPHWQEEMKSTYIKHSIRENEIHKTLNHPRIVKHYDTKEINTNCFCTILEYCPGEDLYRFMKKHKSLTEKEAKNIVVQLFSALKYLHERPERIIHYDLKPQNILMNNGDIKITDFGLAKTIDASLTNMELTSQGVGTYWYQAPECFELRNPRISSKVDVWSAGVIFYELLYGRRPFGHNMSQEVVLKDLVIVKATSVSFPNKPVVSNDCKEFIKRCLEYSQDTRWDAVEAFNSPYLQNKK